MILSEVAFTHQKFALFGNIFDLSMVDIPANDLRSPLPLSGTVQCSLW